MKLSILMCTAVAISFVAGPSADASRGAKSNKKARSAKTVKKSAAKRSTKPVAATGLQTNSVVVLSVKKGAVKGHRKATSNKSMRLVNASAVREIAAAKAKKADLSRQQNPKVTTTRVIVGPLGNPLPGEATTNTVITLQGKVGRKAIFKHLFPEAAALGHKWGYNAASSYRAEQLNSDGVVISGL